MDLFQEIWGSGTDLNILQMCCRGITIFFIALVLIRVSGRRSFGIRTALDNIIVILLGALLSRAVVGASPFLPIVFSSFAIVLLHRIFSWLMAHNPPFSRLAEGEKIVLYENGSFIKYNMGKALVCEEDIMQGIREAIQMNDLKKIDSIYMERNGEISVIKKTTD